MPPSTFLVIIMTCQYCQNEHTTFLLTRTFYYYRGFVNHPMRVCDEHKINPPNHIFGAGRLQPPCRGGEEDSE